MLTADAQAPPLLLASRASRVDGRLNLVVALVEILGNLLAALLDVRDGGLLLDDEGVHVLEQLGQLDHLLLDTLNLGVAVLHGGESGAGLALSAALHEGLAKDLPAVGVFNSLADFTFVGVGAHNAVLAGHLVLVLLAERRLDLLVLLNDLFEAAVHTADLGVVLRGAGVGVGLHGADALDEAAVHCHSLRAEGVKLALGVAGARGVGVCESAILEHAQLVQVVLDLVDALVDGAALVQDGVGVAAEATGSGTAATTALGEGGHLHVGSYRSD